MGPGLGDVHRLRGAFGEPESSRQDSRLCAHVDREGVLARRGVRQRWWWWWRQRRGRRREEVPGEFRQPRVRVDSPIHVAEIGDRTVPVFFRFEEFVFESLEVAGESIADVLS